MTMCAMLRRVPLLAWMRSRSRQKAMRHRRRGPNGAACAANRLPAAVSTGPGRKVRLRLMVQDKNGRVEQGAI